MFAGTGSTISAATVPSFASKSDAIPARSLKGAITVSCAAPAVTPGVPGIPNVATPLPAPRASSASECPW